MWCIAAVSALLFAAEPELTPSQNVYYSASMTMRAKRLDFHQTQLDRLKIEHAAAKRGAVHKLQCSGMEVSATGGPKPSYEFANKKAKDDCVAKLALRMELHELLAESTRISTSFPPEITVDRLAVGQAGRIVYVSDGDPDRAASSFHVFQVIDDHQLIVRGLNPSATTLWVTGVSTAGLVDGADIELDKPIQVAGTKRYETAVGSKTVFVIEPYDTSKLPDLPPIAKADDKPQKKAKSPKSAK